MMFKLRWSTQFLVNREQLHLLESKVKGEVVPVLN